MHFCTTWCTRVAALLIQWTSFLIRGIDRFNEQVRTFVVLPGSLLMDLRRSSPRRRRQRSRAVFDFRGVRTPEQPSPLSHRTCI